MDRKQALPPPLVVTCREDDLVSLLEKEWLLVNRIGAYSSSSVVGCNTRRYHGLLVAATAPPVGRILALSSMMEQLIVGDQTYDLATNEFFGAFSPRGYVHLREFRNDLAATFVYRIGGIELVKEVLLADAQNAVALRYSLRGASGTLRLWPFAAMRDFHGLRKVHEPHQMTFTAAQGGVTIQDRMQADHILHVVSHEATFQAKPQWWYRFLYRSEIARGQEGYEDLYTPGFFEYALAGGGSCQVTATLGDPVPLGFNSTLQRRRERIEQLAGSLGEGADETCRRLAVATDTFVAQRNFPNTQSSATIVAGYHWFADWGRDAFVSLPGLLLATGCYDQARQVFQTFAASISDGMIPNRFDDYASTAHYNSIDASLWFIVAAEHYLAATKDTTFWRNVLMPAAESILEAYHAGTQFDIRADADGLLTGGSYGTQLTWMDAKLGGEVITPRHGKAVEVNALWYNAHRIMADRCRGLNDKFAERCTERAELIGPAFARAFWNARLGYLFDCVDYPQTDGSLRPNQIFAVSLPYSPISFPQQQAVVRVVRDKLLTPMGLRTLSPADSRYRRRYGGSWESRDRAYHQGTVWAWLIGPFIEAYLKVEEYKPYAVEQARQWLSAFDGHLAAAGLGYISEIFDGDGPHDPRGCIAQAWSVAEVLRAKILVAKHSKR